jgi:hypothetical protein
MHCIHRAYNKMNHDFLTLRLSMSRRRTATTISTIFGGLPLTYRMLLEPLLILTITGSSEMVNINWLESTRR